MQERLFATEGVRGKFMQISKFLKYATDKAEQFYPKFHIVTFPEGAINTAQNLRLAIPLFSGLSPKTSPFISLHCQLNIQML